MKIWATDATSQSPLRERFEGYISQFSFAGPRLDFSPHVHFGAIGLVLVTIGVYSVLAYTTARRTHEIGIRMAPGSEQVRCTGNGDSHGLEAGGSRCGNRVNRKCRARKSDCHSALGVSAYGSVDAGVRARVAAGHRNRCVLASRAPRSGRGPLLPLRYECFCVA